MGFMRAMMGNDGVAWALFAARGGSGIGSSDLLALSFARSPVTMIPLLYISMLSGSVCVMLNFCGSLHVAVAFALALRRHVCAAAASRIDRRRLYR
jgi:hypothetical protein